MIKGMMKANNIFLSAVLALAVLFPNICGAETKKGLLVYDSIYSSTVEVAYWIKAIIGIEQQLDVKKLDQVITVAPYDYVIIGSYSKWEKPSPRIYKFVEVWKDELAKKEVCYFLTGGDWDETMVLKAPGSPVKIIAGRNCNICRASVWNSQLSYFVCHPCFGIIAESRNASPFYSVEFLNFIGRVYYSFLI